MEYFFNFNKFNLESGKIPKIFYEKCFYIISKAKPYIKKRNSKELKYAFSTINYLLNNSELNYFELKTKESENIPAATYFITPTILLNHSIKLFDINNQSNFKNATWPEYFAISALALIAEIDHLSNYPKELIDYEYAAKCLADAMECICWAERIESNDFKSSTPSEQAQIILSEKNQQAAIMRRQNEYEYKQQYIAFYLSGTWKTYAECLRAFLDSAANQPPATIRNHDRVLKEALTAYIKQFPFHGLKK
jgi:hypothetical protein